MGSAPFPRLILQEATARAEPANCPISQTRNDRDFAKLCALCFLLCVFNDEERRRQQRLAQALVRASDFAGTLVTDFTHNPPPKVDLKFTTTLGKLEGAITQLGGKQAIQSGGAYAQQSEAQARLRKELLELLHHTSDGAQSIATDQGNPAAGDKSPMT